MWQPCNWKTTSTVSFSLKRKRAFSMHICSHETSICWSFTWIFCRCKYLYLLFDDQFLVNQNYVFTTEGHPLPVMRDWQERLPETFIPTNWTFFKVLISPYSQKQNWPFVIHVRSIHKLLLLTSFSFLVLTGWSTLMFPAPWCSLSQVLESVKSMWNLVHFWLKQTDKRTRGGSAMSLQLCPALSTPSHGPRMESACHVPDARGNHRCLTDEDCGIDSSTCRRRSCSMAGYCGLWLSLWYHVHCVHCEILFRPPPLPGSNDQGPALQRRFGLQTHRILSALEFRPRLDQSLKIEVGLAEYFVYLPSHPCTVMSGTPFPRGIVLSGWRNN